MYNKIYCIRQHYLFIHKATCFDLSVGHLQAYIQTKSLVLCTHWDPNMFTLIKYIKSGKFLCRGRNPKLKFRRFCVTKSTTIFVLISFC